MLPTKDEWLAKRRELVTASDVAAILGYSPHRTALDVYVSKKTATETPDNDYMLLGRMLEDGIARVYQEKTRRHVSESHPYNLEIHHTLPWLGATPDRIVYDWQRLVDNGQPLELKHVGSHKYHEWQDEPPLWLQIQVQIQIACHGSEWGAYCAVIGGDTIKYGDIDRNDRFLEAALPVLDEFRRRLVENDPPPVESPKHLAAVKALYPDDSGETVELGEDIQLLTEQWEAAKRISKDSSDQAQEIEAKIRAAIGEATFGKLPNGNLLTLKTTHRKGFTTTVEPTSFRTLRIKGVK